MQANLILILLVIASAVSAKTNLRVLIFPYIPDLNNDNLESLRNFIQNKFNEANTDIELTVDSNKDVYDVDKMKEYLGSDEAKAYDVVEIDTVLLGELVDAGLLQQNPYPLKADSFLPFSVNAVTDKRNVYGVPTLVCANFLIKMASKGGKLDLPLIGNFRGSWTLPGHYLSAYVNQHGPNSMTDAVISKPEEQMDVVKVIQELSNTCRRDESNPCTNKKYNTCPNEMIEDLLKSKHSDLLAYSEVMGHVIHKYSNSVNFESVDVPFAGKYKLLQMYTDAVVANRNSYSTKQDEITRFIKFYTSTSFRVSYAFSEDVENFVKPCRYVLMADKSFYEESKVKSYPIYEKFYALISQHGISAPNRNLYGRRSELNRKLSELLNYDKTQKL